MTGTTTRPERMAEVRAACDDAAVLRGEDRDAVGEVVASADAVVVCVSPPEARAVTLEGRLALYRTALVETARSVAAAAGSRSVLAISSLSVLGPAVGAEPLDESADLPTLADPSPRAYGEAEAIYLDLPRATVLRAPDIVSPGDLSVVEKVRLAHEHLGGSVPFDDRALAYRVTADEVAQTVDAILANGPQGVLHVVPDATPPTNGELYGGACAEAALPPLTFRREIQTPTVEVRSTKLASLGLVLTGPR